MSVSSFLEPGRVLIERAQRQLGHGDLEGAVESLRQALSEDPDHAGAHAFLALCLHDQKRLTAAEHEARLALRLEPELDLGHFALGIIALAKQDTRTAEQSFRRALEIDPEDLRNTLGLARAFLLRRDSARALEWVERALELDPESVECLVLKGTIHLERGEVDAARALAEQALGIDAEDIDACVLLGNVLLIDGDIERARQLGALALSRNPRNEGAVELLVRIRSRRQPLLRLWWPYAAWMQRRHQNIQILILVAAYVSLQAMNIAYRQGQVGASVFIVFLLWLGFCILTWVAPALIKRAVEKELRATDLKPEY